MRLGCWLFGHHWHGGLTYLGFDGDQRVHVYRERCTACRATRLVCERNRYGVYTQLHPYEGSLR
jgi:hypothetical protein